MKTIRRILVPHDLSKPAQRLLEYALQAALSLRADLILVHVIHPRDIQAITTAINRNLVVEREVHPEIAVRQFKQERLERLQAAVRAAGRADLCCKLLVRVGEPWAELLDVLQSEGADLVILGHRGRGAIRGLLQEASFEKLLRLCPVPVLCVRGDYLASTLQGPGAPSIKEET